MVKNTKIILEQVAVILVGIIILAIGGYFIYSAGYKTAYKEFGDTAFLTMETEEEKTYANPYAFFLDDEKAEYIETYSKALGVDPDLVVAILMQENPTLNERAYHINENGTVDLGLFQLNDRYLNERVKKYWKFDEIEFNSFNWKHNTYIAINLIKELSVKFTTVEQIASAYNCGVAKTLANNIPASTKRYMENVGNNYNMIQGL